MKHSSGINFVSSEIMNHIDHRLPGEEKLFFLSILNGDIDAVRKNCDENRFLDMDGVGILSKDPIVNLKYHYVITAALVTRLCVEKGLEWELAFRMSDYHIQRLDGAKTIQDIQILHDNMVLDFAQMMNSIQNRNKYSKHVNTCKNYIYSHLTERINVDEIAEAIGVSSSYLSRLFKQETGQSVSDYIRSHKIEQAKNLLRYSDYSIIEISNRLAFSSQSHFAQQFRECVGMTPKKYRDANYMKVWQTEGDEVPAED